MSPRPHYRHENFAPLRDKTLTTVLRQLFVTQFGYENKVLFADAMIARILETIETFVKPTELLQPGQLLWMAVVHDGGKHAHCAMKEIPQVPVVLDLVANSDLQALADKTSFKAVRRQRHARLLDQAFAQGGVLSQNDLAAITLTTTTVVGNDVRRVQREEERVLPYRGSVQDTGATLTHKVETIRLFEAGHLEPDICRLLPVVHDLQSVENYVQTYKNVLKLLERGFSPGEVSGILGVSERLVNAYIAIIREHHPEILAQNFYCQEQSDASNSPPI